MTTLNDIIHEITMIREAINCIETKGKQNLEYTLFAYNKCTELIDGLNQTIDELSNQNGGQSTPTEEDQSTPEVGE